MNNKFENKKIKKLRRPRSSIFYLIVTLIIFTIFSFFIFRYFSYLKTKIPKEGDFLQVVIAKENIPAFTIISEEMITIKEIPESYLLNNAVLDKDLILGKVANYPFYKGEQIIVSKIGKNISDLMAFSENIPQDKRVITLPLDSQSMIPYTVKPGDKVDVIASFHANDDILSNTQLIATAKTVVSVSNNFSKSPDLNGKNDGQSNLDFNFLDVNFSNSERWITLLVLPEEVIEISRAMASGRLFFSLCPSNKESEFYGN